MSVENILVLKNYRINDHSKWYGDRTQEHNIIENYKAMEGLCIESAKRYVQDLHRVHVFEGEADNIRDVFKTNFYEIYDLWKEGNNILYTDLDVIFINPVRYFNRTNYFSMFNYTDPRSTEDDHYNIDIDHFFNCGIRYYPANMSHEIWDIGFEMLENWNPERWDSEQVIYNVMMWSQDISLQEVYKPKLAYQYLYADQEQICDNWNGISYKDCSAVHVHGSRGSGDRLALMTKLFTWQRAMFP